MTARPHHFQIGPMVAEDGGDVTVLEPVNATNNGDVEMVSYRANIPREHQGDGSDHVTMS